VLIEVFYMHNATAPPPPPSKSSSNCVAVGVSVGVGVLALAGLLSLIFFCVRRWRQRTWPIVGENGSWPGKVVVMDVPSTYDYDPLTSGYQKFFNLLMILVDNLVFYLRKKLKTKSVTTDTAFALI
jgi:hypothetical protein